MSNPTSTLDKLTSKQKHNQESITKTIEREYETISKEDLEEPSGEISESELTEPANLIDSVGVPDESELKSTRKPDGTPGSAGKDLKRNAAGRFVKGETKESKVEKDKVVDDGYLLVPGMEKIAEEEAK